MPMKYANYGSHKSLVYEDSAIATHYKCLSDVEEKVGRVNLGTMANQIWHDNPRAICWRSSRYKFVAKMLSGRRDVAEIGCGDGFFSRIVKQEVGSLTCYDIEQEFIDDARRHGTSEKWPIAYHRHDMTAGFLPERYDAIYCLDVMEHLSPPWEEAFIWNITKSLNDGGVFIAGCPSLESQAYASDNAKASGHINCKSGEAFKAGFERWFRAVFLFGMNDEVIHTGFSPMAQYLFAVCADAK